ncbi:TPA: hypothetical protein ACGOWL_000407 [Streptococcus suis]
MKKIDWIEYFEAVNGRSPEEAEIAQALAAGEFEEEQVVEQSKVTVEETVTGQSSAERVQESFSQAAAVNHFENVAANPQVQEWKNKGNDYLNWVIQALKKPNDASNKQNFIYSVVTVILSGALLSAAFVYFIRNVSLSFINTSVGGVTIQSTSPEVYDKLVLAIEGGFGLGAVLKFGLAIVAFYVASIILPVLFLKFIQKTNLDLKTEFVKASQFTPILLVLNAIGFISTFFVKKSLIVSNDIQNELTSLFATINSNPMQSVTDLFGLVNRVPAIDSVVKVFTCISFVSFLGALVVFVAIAKNTKFSYKKIDNFYVTTILILIVTIGLYYLNNFISSEILTIFQGIYSAMLSSY